MSLQYLVYCGWLIIELVFVVTYIVETRGRTLEETAVLFDGEEPTQDLQQRGGQAATTGMGQVDVRLAESKHESRAQNEFLELQEVSSVHGSSTDELSMHSRVEYERKGEQRLCRISEHSDI